MSPIVVGIFVFCALPLVWMAIEGLVQCYRRYQAGRRFWAEVDAQARAFDRLQRSVQDRLFAEVFEERK